MLAKSSGNPLAGRSIENTGRFFCFASIFGLVLVLPHAVDALLHFSHAIQVLIELYLVGRADLAW